MKSYLVNLKEVSGTYSINSAKETPNASANLASVVFSHLGMIYIASKSQGKR